MNLEMHLHLNSELASNEFLTEFAFKIRKIPSGLALARQSGEQATVGSTHASMSVGGHALPPHPLFFIWLHPAPPPHSSPHTHTTTTPVFPSSSVSSTVCGDESLRIPEAFCCLVCITFYDHIFLSLGFLSLLRYIVCVCALIRPKIRNKILASCIFIQFRLDQQGTKLC